MVHRCCVSSCGMNVRVAEAKGLTYHCFPIKEPNRDKWIQSILPHVDKPETFKVVQGYTRVCSRHFRRKDYTAMDSRKRARLNTNAIPSVFQTKTATPAESFLENIKPALASQETLETILPETDASCGVLSKPEISIKIENDPLENESAPEPSESLILTLSEDLVFSASCPTAKDAIKNVSNSEISKSKSAHQKRRRNPRNSNSHSSKPRKKFLTSDELNIEGVGEALAEINLSTLMASTNDSHRANDGDCKSIETASEKSSNLSEVSSAELKSREDDCDIFLMPDLNVESPSIRLGGDEYETQMDTQRKLESEILESIQAVKIHSQDSVCLTGLPFLAADNDARQEINNVPDSSHINHQLDLSSDLLNGNFSSLDSSLTSFESQDLLEAIRSNNDFPSADEIDKLACDLNSSFLDNEGLNPLLLDLDDVRISDLELTTFNSDHWIDFGNDMISQLSHITFEPAAPASSPLVLRHQDVSQPVSTQPESAPDYGRKRTPTPPPKKLPRTSLEVNEAPVVGTKKKKNSNCTGRFSAERFHDSDKDIEYYTGFNTYQSFEKFYHNLESHAEKLKVTDIMYGANSLQAATESQQDSNSDDHGSTSGQYLEDPKRRLSQGRSMIRIDELFMTLIRLKRKLPEKVLGHMFCTSQSTVCRTVRAWTMLLSKVVETSLPSKSTSRKSKNIAPIASDENNIIPSNAPGSGGIPDAVLKLFHSELARSIVSSGNSRKTSCSTSTSNSRSKRPKKEKSSGVSTDCHVPLFSGDVPDRVTTSDNRRASSTNISIRELCIHTDDSLVLSDQVSGDFQINGEYCRGFVISPIL